MAGKVNPTKGPVAVSAALEAKHPGLKIKRYIDTGSTAHVFHVDFPISPSINLSVERIVKVFRHESTPLEEVGATSVFLNEIDALLTTSHSNVIALYYADELPIPDVGAVPYYVMEYVKGAQDLDEWIRRRADQLTRDEVVALMLQACEGLSAIHKANRLHCDIKFGNLLVGDEGVLKVADLGFSKRMNVSGREKTCVFTTFVNFPNVYKQYIQQMANKNAAYAFIPREELRVPFDLHFLGCVISNLLALQPVARLFSPDDRSYLSLVASRLDLDTDAPELPRFESVEQVREAIKKLELLFLRKAGVEELNTYAGTRSVRIPVTGSVPFSGRIQRLISHPLFLRLHNAHQLGFTYLVFPGAVHTRFEHCLGVYSNLGNYINALLADDRQPYFRQLISRSQIETALLAGLLHDIGQHSFAHCFEDYYLDDAHEQRSVALLQGKNLSDLVPPDLAGGESLFEIIANDWPDVSLPHLAWLISGEQPGDGLQIDVGWQILRSLLNGPIDADKTDYLLRDAHHSGVEYARSIDLRRLTNSLTGCVIRSGGTTQGVLGVTWKGVQAAESVIFARTHMFWVLYWHHAVRAAHSMLAHAVDAHRRNSDSQGVVAFNRSLLAGTIGETLALLRQSSDPTARQLASALTIRQLFKRAVQIDYEGHSELYEQLQQRKVQLHAAGDYVMAGVTAKLAGRLNTALGVKGIKHRFDATSLLLDVPLPGKDRMGPLYMIGKGDDAPIKFESRAMHGSREDWQNRVRTIRVFVPPDTSREVRAVVASSGPAALHEAVR